MLPYSVQQKRSMGIAVGFPTQYPWFTFPDLQRLVNLGMRQKDMPPQGRRNEEKNLYFSMVFPLSMCSRCPFLYKNNLPFNSGALALWCKSACVGARLPKWCQRRRKGQECTVLDKYCTFLPFPCGAGKHNKVTCCTALRHTFNKYVPKYQNVSIWVLLIFDIALS